MKKLLLLLALVAGTVHADDIAEAEESAIEDGASLQICAMLVETAYDEVRKPLARKLYLNHMEAHKHIPQFQFAVDTRANLKAAVLVQTKTGAKELEKCRLSLDHAAYALATTMVNKEQ
ncbi:hypothetical protein JCM19236_5656 [Vibrio sp. JCM 19236]|nr:hypothetical protein JCM19236_5656 [Vibrio sp. JCM 19236]